MKEIVRYMGEGGGGGGVSVCNFLFFSTVPFHLNTPSFLLPTFSLKRYQEISSAFVCQLVSNTLSLRLYGIACFWGFVICSNAP
jgi:hypothetical protein